MDIRVVTDPTDIAECLRLRAAVFIEEQDVSLAEERDGLDDACTHFLATDPSGPIGAARLNYLSEDYAKIQRVCVIRCARGSGAGAKIIGAMIEQVRADGKRRVIRLGAQTHAMDFYRKLGFEAFGAEYMDAGIPHRDMELRL